MSPKTKEQFDAIRQQTMTMIKEVALELFAQNGYHGTSINQIARKAGVSKGLMYNYFESKEALLHAIVLEMVQQGEAFMESVMERKDYPLAKLEEITRLSIEMVRADVKHWRLLTSLGLQTEVIASLKTTLQAKTKNAFQFAIRLFQEMGVEDPEKEAFIYGAFLDGVFLHFVSMTELELDYPLETMMEFILSRYQNYNV